MKTREQKRTRAERCNRQAKCDKAVARRMARFVIAARGVTLTMRKASRSCVALCRAFHAMRTNAERLKVLDAVLKAPFTAPESTAAGGPVGSDPLTHPSAS